MLKGSAIDIAKESERGIVDIETHKRFNNNLISTIWVTLKIQADGNVKRQKVELELANIEDQLRGKLHSLQS